MSDAWDWALDSPVPQEVSTGRGSALLLHGWLFHRRAEVTGLRVRVGDVSRPVSAFGMPRLDVYVARCRPGDAPAHATFRCAFWAIVPLPGVDVATPVELALEAVAANGASVAPVVAQTTLRPGRGTAPAAAPAGRVPEVAIAMATHNPDPERFARQVDSLRAQTFTDWVCVVSDDRSLPDRYEAMLTVLGDDPRFVVSRSPVRQGFYWNFGRAMGLVPEGVRHVALCDQDDEWRPEKLARLRAAMAPGVTLAFSDQRIVAADGRVIAPSYWGARENNWTDLGALFSTNTVTGAAALFRRELLERILPLPPRVVQAYHDHWVALCALATGRIAYVDEPLYDYVQHSDQVIGHADGASLGRPDAASGAGLRHRRGNRRTRWEADYFEVSLPRHFLAIALRERCRDGMSGRAARAVRWAAQGEIGMPGLALTLARATRELGRPELTLGHDQAALRGAVWRRVARRAARRGPYDDPAGTVVHTSGLQELPGVAVLAAARPHRARPELAVDAAAPRRVCVLTTGDAVPAGALAGALARVGRDARVVRPGEERLTVSPGDDVVAMDRGAAVAAAGVATELGRRGFLLVIHGLTPPDPEACALTHAALFATELVRDWFAAEALGVFAPGGMGAEGAAVYRPAIGGAAPPSAERLRARRVRRVLLHTRPEAPGASTLPDLARLVLGDLAGDGTLDGWELYGLGADDGPAEAVLPGGRALEGLAPVDPERHAALYAGFDLALAPIDAPPPGRAPLALAAAGVVTVTTTFGPKDDAALRAISGNLRGAAPDRAALGAALRAAAADVERAEDRVRSAAFDWPARWDDAFDAVRVAALLDALR